MSHLLRARGASLLLVAFVASCGGGSGAEGEAALAASPPASSSASQASAGPGAPATPGTPTPPASQAITIAAACAIPDFAATALVRINALRAAGANCRTAGVFAPAAATSWSPLLILAATAHSNDMVANNFFSHTGSNGSTLATRVSATGYAWSAIGENIAAGYPSIDSVMNGWMASDGHCANLMNPSFNQVGLACVVGASGNFWTMDLARAR